MGSIDQANSTTIALNASDSFTGSYTSTTNFAEICISVETDTKFQLTVNFSSNFYDNTYEKTFIENTPSSNAFIYRVQPYLGYFNIVITNIDTVDQTYLRVSTIQKSNVLYQENGNTPASNVAITSPLNQDGSVFVGGNLALSGSVDANITNTSLDVNVLNLMDLSGVAVDISGQNVNVSNLMDLSGIVVDINGQSVVVSGDVNIFDSNGNNLLGDGTNLYINLNESTTFNNGNNQLKVDISGQSVNVSNLMDLSGVRVDISGESVNVSNLMDLSGIAVDISGQSVNVSNLMDLSGVRVDISGESVNVSNLMDLSGVRVDISGESVNVSNLMDLSGVRVDISGESVNVSNLMDLSGVRVDISGESVNVSNLLDLSGVAVNVNNLNKGSTVVWANNLVAPNGTSIICDLSGIYQTNITIFGSLSASTVLTVQFSNDNILYWDSQYSYNQSAVGDFGFNIQASPLYLRLKSSNAVTATAFINYS